MSPSELAKIFDNQKANKSIIGTSTTEQRKEKLLRLKQYLLAHTDEVCEAAMEDFSKPAAETIISELLVLVNEISYTCKNLKRWMEPQRLATPLAAIGTSSYIHYEAKGNVLIMAPWNYPVGLAIKPLISAIAAGCTAIIKPSEMTPKSSRFVRKMIESMFSPDEVTVVEGDAELARELLKLPFDHIFFTGSPATGKEVMKAAAENLTSVTLELGGKSPSVVDETADIAKTAENIIWAKFFNNGQTCIAPDYILVQESVREDFINALKISIRKLYDPEDHGIELSSSYARIVNERHFNRLAGYLDDAISQGAQIAFGGIRNIETRFISPTILTGVSDNMKVMQEEIFGPLLPVIPYQKLSEAITYINAKPKPLALYVHSRNRANTDYVLQNTSSGNAMVNELLTQFSNPELPFGGVNNSGIGKSNGIYGFREFSNAKGIMRRRFGTMKFLYPPYSDKLVTWLKKGLRYL